MTMFSHEDGLRCWQGVKPALEFELNIYNNVTDCNMYNLEVLLYMYLFCIYIQPPEYVVYA